MGQKMGELCVTRDRNPVKRSVTLGLSRPAFEALAGGEDANSERVANTLENAVRFYLGDRGTGRPAWPYPAFLRESRAQEDVELQLSVDDRLWRSFEGEADEQGVSVQQLAEHVAFYLAAEMDAGRITERILDDLESPEAGG
jgi:hypothetical protein